MNHVSKCAHTISVAGAVHLGYQLTTKITTKSYLAHFIITADIILSVVWKVLILALYR